MPAAIDAATGEILTHARLDRESTRLAHHLRALGLRRGDTIAIVAGNDLRIFSAYAAAIRSGLYVTAVNVHLTPGEVNYILTDCEAKALFAGADTAGAVTEALRIPALAEPGRAIAWGGTIPGFADYDAVLAAADSAPLYHAASLRFCGVTMSVGGTVVMMHRFDPEEALALIEKYRVMHSQWVPTMFVRMLKLPEATRARYDTSSPKVAIHAAAPCPAEVKQSMLAWWGPVIHEYYASTESAGATFIGPQEALERPGSVGRAGLGVARICGDDGALLPPGEVGTIYFEREQMPFSYHNAPEKTRAAQHPEHANWATTGDVGYLDEDGYLYLTDRKDFMIISGGVNIYPQEAENALIMHPAVTDVAVIGVPDDELGETALACVQLAPGTAPSDELARELIEYAARDLARYKLPRAVRFVDSLPRTPTGKLVKRLIAL